MAGKPKGITTATPDVRIANARAIKIPKLPKIKQDIIDACAKTDGNPINQAACTTFEVAEQKKYKKILDSFNQGLKSVNKWFLSNIQIQDIYSLTEISECSGIIKLTGKVDEDQKLLASFSPDSLPKTYEAANQCLGFLKKKETQFTKEAPKSAEPPKPEEPKPAERPTAKPTDPIDPLPNLVNLQTLAEFWKSVAEEAYGQDDKYIKEATTGFEKDKWNYSKVVPKIKKFIKDTKRAEKIKADAMKALVDHIKELPDDDLNKKGKPIAGTGERKWKNRQIGEKISGWYKNQIFLTNEGRKQIESIIQDLHAGERDISSAQNALNTVITNETSKIETKRLLRRVKKNTEDIADLKSRMDRHEKAEASAEGGAATGGPEVSGGASTNDSASRATEASAALSGKSSVYKEGNNDFTLGGEIKISMVAQNGALDYNDKSELKTPTSDVLSEYSAPLSLTDLNLKLSYSYLKNSDKGEEQVFGASLAGGIFGGKSGLQIVLNYNPIDFLSLMGEFDWYGWAGVLPLNGSKPNFKRVYILGGKFSPTFKAGSIDKKKTGKGTAFEFAPYVEVSKQLKGEGDKPINVGGGANAKVTIDKQTISANGGYTYLDVEAPCLKYANDGALNLGVAYVYNIAWSWLNSVGLALNYFRTSFEGKAGDARTSVGSGSGREFVEDYVLIRAQVEFLVGGGLCIPVGVGPDIYNGEPFFGFGFGLKKCE